MLAVAVILSLAITCACTSDVPVLIWSQHSPLSHVPQVHLGNTVRVSEFSQNYLTPLTSQKDGNLVVFLQEKLSLQDFTKYADVYNSFSDGGAFKNVKALMDENFSVQLPAVSSPDRALDMLKKTFEGNIHDVSSPADLNDLNLGSRNLIIVHLSPAGDVLSEEEAITSNDEQIGEVVRRLNKMDLKYTALYTAKRAVQVENEVRSVKRRLLADESFNEVNNGTFLNITCMFFYVRSITAYLDKGGKNTTIQLNDTTKFVDDGSMCDNSTATLKFTYSDDSSVKLTVMFNISDKNTSEWQVETLQVQVSGSVNNVDYTGEANMNTKRMNIWAPKDFSYHCSYLPVVNATGDNTTTVNVSLIFDGLQLQPFNIMDNQFSDGWDCVPFFTEGIWMGLLSVLLLTLILLYGFSMLADIKTMDKFDDAKGKTITVTATD